MIFLLVASFPESLITFRGALIEALLARGLRVHIAAPGLGVDSHVRQRLESKGVVVHEVPLRRTGMNPFADARTLLALWWLMRTIRPHYVMAYTVKPVVYGLLAAWLARVPRRFALITGLGYAFQGQDEAKGARRLLRYAVHGLYAAALRHADKVFFQNPDDEALFRASDILENRTSSVVINGSGVDINEFSATPLPDAPHFLLIARLLGDKGVREFAQAAANIRLRHPSVRFSLAGWIDDNPNAVSQHELDSWVSTGTLEYLGRLSDVRPALSACSVYVLPSYREGTPRTVLEAMAMARPIITTDTPGCRETIVDGENRYLIPVKSVDALIVAMERFINEPSLSHRLGHRSRVLAETKYDVHEVNKIMLKEMGIA
ncbi:MAG TPA: glycosyltransferase family 4 protein [Candidimonas sp.]|nr:glycosyltransferase family 4 protein [Candidimonas sp.]